MARLTLFSTRRKNFAMEALVRRLAPQLAGAPVRVAVVLPGGGRVGPAMADVTLRFQDWASLAHLAAGRIGSVAEAMVDADVAIPGVVDKGKLLTLTTDEALRLKVADHRADTLADALAAVGLAGAEARRIDLNWAEQVVRTLTHPLVASLLVTVAMLGIVIELRTPGFGVPGALGVAALALVLWGHSIAQLAGMEEMLLIAAGLLLLALELLVIPGFGIAGAAYATAAGWAMGVAMALWLLRGTPLPLDLGDRAAVRQAPAAGRAGARAAATARTSGGAAPAFPCGWTPPHQSRWRRPKRGSRLPSWYPASSRR